MILLIVSYVLLSWWSWSFLSALTWKCAAGRRNLNIYDCTPAVCWWSCEEKLPSSDSMDPEVKLFCWHISCFVWLKPSRPGAHSQHFQSKWSFSGSIKEHLLIFRWTDLFSLCKQRASTAESLRTCGDKKNKLKKTFFKAKIHKTYSFRFFNEDTLCCSFSSLIFT